MRILFCLSMLFFLGCSTSKKVVSSNPSDDLMELQGLMTGSFASSKQAAADSAFYDISLHMYPVWQNRAGNWIYVEQAVTSKQDKPYRQRLYKLEKEENGQFISRVYAFEKPEDFIGKWKTPEFFSQFDTSILKEREGCEVYLSKEKNIYAGSTLDKNCGSTMRGATYATSKVVITSKAIESWDQGFNDKGEQVWGAEKGGYVFDKLRSNN